MTVRALPYALTAEARHIFSTASLTSFGMTANAFLVRCLSSWAFPACMPWPSRCLYRLRWCQAPIAALQRPYRSSSFHHAWQHSGSFPKPWSTWAPPCLSLSLNCKLTPHAVLLIAKCVPGLSAEKPRRGKRVDWFIPLEDIVGWVGGESDGSALRNVLESFWFSLGHQM